MNKVSNNIYRNYLKRGIDFFLALIALIVLSVVLLFIGILVKVKLGSPIIFKQKRPGLYGETFVMYKFRTMTEKRDEKGELLPDSMRLTKFGKFLRSTSLDELPELYNILKGEMSIVGPRPLLVEYLALYTNEQMRRHEVRPGLTGLAQISGRNTINWDDKFDLDLKYVDNVSFLGDCHIIFMTIKKVIYREGINSTTTETMEQFKGSEIKNEE